jgi:dTDP-4-amino-4,6-dideoxygalactose transaminase
MDPARLEETIESFSTRYGLSEARKIKAIIPVHLYGHPAAMRAIEVIADDRGLLVIEDCAQAHGASIAGRMTGTWGLMAAYSFYPTKNLGALGDAGALVTDSAEMVEKTRLVREYGWKKRYISDLPGLNSRLDPIQAAVLRVKLNYLEAENQQRRHLAETYHRFLEGCDAIVLPVEAEGCRHVYHQYVVRTERRDDLQEFLQKRGVGTLIHYPVPVHRQPAYEERFFSIGLEETERLCGEILSLPITPDLSESQIQEVASVIRAWSGDQGS